jgi:hypothetical protein
MQMKIKLTPNLHPLRAALSVHTVPEMNQPLSVAGSATSRRPYSLSCLVFGTYCSRQALALKRPRELPGPPSNSPVPPTG